MDLVESCSEILSNTEVLNILQNYKSKKQTNLATILYETTSYLRNSPAANTSIPRVAEFLDVLKEKRYDLTKLEKIQLVNLIPEKESELQLMINNIEDQSELLNLIKLHLIEPGHKKVKT